MDDVTGARMAARLTARLPQARVVTSTFERWQPPAGGVPLIACALAWHWLDPATRNRRAHDALIPGGTLAVFGHKYDHADPGQSRALDGFFRSAVPTAPERPAGWFHRDISTRPTDGSATARSVRRRATAPTGSRAQAANPSAIAPTTGARYNSGNGTWE